MYKAGVRIKRFVINEKSRWNFPPAFLINDLQQCVMRYGPTRMMSPSLVMPFDAL